VRDHYTALLYGVDPARLRTADPERYLALSRAAVAEVMEATIGEWRRPGSSCAGALVLQWQDLRPGAGWGVLDSLGRPKSVWHALKRAFQPVQLLISDEGVNGLHLHALNDGAEPAAALISFACLRDGRLRVAFAERSVLIPERGAVSLSTADLLGRFFDVNYAYRFGPPEHDVCLAMLKTEDGATLAQASFWVPGRRAERHHLGLAAKLEQDGAGWLLRLSSQRMAAALAIDDEGLLPEDNHFDLAPGVERLVRLRQPSAGADRRPGGQVGAINGIEMVRYSAGA
jgi:beta-mannosidase